MQKIIAANWKMYKTRQEARETAAAVAAALNEQPAPHEVVVFAPFTAIAEVFRRVVAGEAGNTGKAGNIGNAGSIEDTGNTGNIGNAGNAEQRIVLYNDFPGSTVSAIELTCM